MIFTTAALGLLAGANSANQVASKPATASAAVAGREGHHQPDMFSRDAQGCTDQAHQEAVQANRPCPVSSQASTSTPRALGPQSDTQAPRHQGPGWRGSAMTGDAQAVGLSEAASASGAWVCLMNICAATMPTSYRMHIGMASASCEITSGGVTTAATMKDDTMK